VWNGHCCPLPSTLGLLLTLTLIFLPARTPALTLPENWPIRVNERDGDLSTTTKALHLGILRREQRS